ncbi:MAG: hypothetical protein GWP32_04510 [Bacteroidetes bacterium]|nr:hypothetical protein [Bacteroidota bacterium]
MKTTKLIITTLLGFFINAASAENFSLGTKYSSDYFFRGTIQAEESVQVGLGISGKVSGVDYSARAFTNQSVNTGTDSYIFAGGISSSFMESLVEVYLGLNHVENVSGEAALEANLAVSLDTALSPTLSLFRNLDDSLYTSELSVSHTFKSEICDLTASASAGNTDASNSEDNTYYTAGLEASRALGEKSSVGLSLLRVDSETIGEEYVVGLGISTQF